MTTATSIDSDTQFKAISGQIGIDKAQGIVEAFVSAIGNKDSVGDIVIPGAFNDSLKRRKPRVVWGHDWNQPIGKVLEIYEVAPNDPRLPAKMKNAGVGGLFAKVQFNLNTERGREAFANVAFYGNEQEWCVDTETEILTDRGWLKYDEVTTDDRAYTLDPELGWGKFEQIESVNIWPAKQRQMRHIETGGHSSLTTAAHRWPLASNENGGNVKWATTETLRPQDGLIRSAVRSDAPVVQKYTDAFVELVGWFWTEGWVPPADHSDAGLYVAQSTEVNPQHVASIRAALQSEFPGHWSERHSSDNMARFRITREAAETILAVTGEGKAPTPEFLTNLTRSQLTLLIQTCLNGDGHETKAGQRTWYQLSDNGVRMFEMLCALAGQPTNTTIQKDYGNRYGAPPVRVSLLRNGVSKPLDAIRVKKYKYKGGEERTPSVDEWITTDGEIWCPTTPSGTWLARRNGAVYFTGNSIGYKTINADFDAIKQANILKEVELYEISPVLHGANQLTATISVKDDSSGAASKSSSEDLKGAGVYMKPTGMVPSASWDDDDDDDDDMSERLGMMLSQVLRKPVKIIEMGRDTIIFQTAPDMMWRASVTMGSGQMMIGRPTRVKPMVTYTPVGDSAPASMMIKYTDEKDAEEPEGIRDSSDDQGSWDTPEAALAWAKTLGCQGFHTLGNGYLPCDSHADYLDAIRMFDDNANINSRNNYLAGVDVSEAKGAAGTCGCGSEVKGHMYVQDKKPDYLQDPMALMLMAYNEMLKLRGATEVREATLSVISALEEFLTEAPMSIGMEQGEKIASGVIVHVKCSEIEALSVSKAVADLPVFTFKSDSGVDVHFTTLAEEDEIFEKVAFALAKLDFDPGLKFTRPTEI